MMFKKRISNVISMVFMFGALGMSTAQAAIEWQWTSPTPQGNTLNAVVYNGTNQYVAVGDFGTVMTSVDSYTWVNGVSGTTKALNDVIWNGTEYLAVGDAGVVLKSTDGLTWVASNINTALQVAAVVWDGSQYVAVGSLDRVWTSADGITWTETNLPTTSGLTDIIWTGAQLVTVGASGTVYTSPNGMTWTLQTTPSTSLFTAVAWNGALYVAVGLGGATMSSPDGVTWTDIAWTIFSTHLWNIAWDGTQFVAGSNAGRFYTSADGNWGAALYLAGDNTFQSNGIHSASGRLVAVGTGGRVYTSLGAASWTLRVSGLKGAVGSMANNGTIAVALSETCTYMTSADATNWITYPSAMPASNFCTDIVWASGISKFVALTASGSTVGNIYSSVDGINWALISTTGPTRAAAMAYSPTTGYVAVGTPDYTTGQIWSSSDGITWTVQATSDQLNDVAWVNNQFIAVGNNGSILTSPDGTTWTIRVSGVTTGLQGIAASATTYVASGPLNTVLTSSDSVSWFPQSTGFSSASTGWGSLFWTGNQFILSGATNGDATLVNSVDGVNWVSSNLITNNVLDALDIFAGKMLAGGLFGTVISGANIDVVTTPSAGVTEVTEGGATDSFDMVLASAPSADVTITLSTNPQVTFSPTQLTFTPLNWNMAQTTTVTAVDDAVSEATVNIVLTPSLVSADTRYHGYVVSDVAITVFDNDTPAVNIIQSGGSTAVIEGGATDTYDVVLATLPTANVNVAIATAQGQVSTSVNTLVFTSANWNTPQTVTVTAIDDAVVEGAHSDDITHTITSVDTGYDGLAVPLLSGVSIADNDVGSVTLTESGGSTDIAEGGSTDSFDIVLGLQPSANVSVSVTGASNQCTTDNNPVVFTPTNWNVVQTVVVTAVDDGVVEGNHVCNIITGVTSSSTGYHFIAVPNVSVNVTDNDSIDVVLTESAGSTEVAEGGATDAYDVVLNSEPQLNVTINLSPDAQLSTNTAALTFTPANWNVPQTVVVTAVDDSVVEGAHAGVVSHTITSSDPGYSGFVVADVNVNITDNDRSSTDDPTGGSGGGCIAPTSSSIQQTIVLFGILVSGCLLMRRRKEM